MLMYLIVLGALAASASFDGAEIGAEMAGSTGDDDDLGAVPRGEGDGVPDLIDFADEPGEDEALPAEGGAGDGVAEGAEEATDGVPSDGSGPDGAPGGGTPDLSDPRAADESPGDLTEARDDRVESAEDEDELAGRDPWLDGWTDDEFISSDLTPPPEGPPVEEIVLMPNEDGAERDPWLDGWTDDEFISSDSA